MDQVTIYGRLSCGFCVRAIDLCEMKDFSYRFVDMVKEGISKADLAKTVGRPVHTVPQILVGEEYVGGFDRFSQYVQQRDAAKVR